MSEQDYRDPDLLREDVDRRRRRAWRGCLCGYPDWPGHCPGAENCPVHGQDLSGGEE